MNIASKQIVIIDDAQDLRAMMETLLTSKGFSVHVARNAHEGLELIRRISPDVAIIDICLPDTSGLELASQIRLDPGIRDLTTIAMSGMVLEDDRTKAIQAGFDYVIPKPPNFAQLDEILRKGKLG